MSYILDALKKSDHERKQGSVPGLQTVHLPVSIESSSSRWPYIVIAFLMLSLAFVLGLLRPWDDSIQTVENNIVKEKDTTEKIINPVSKVQKELAVINPRTQQRQNDAKVPVVIQQAEPLKKEIYQVVKKPEPSVEFIEKTPSPEIDSVPHLYDMPPLVQQAIPDMIFAGHVYSSDANQRSVIVNGHSMSEGEVVIDGLKVEKITQKGVEFNYRGQLFRMEILQDWSFD